MMMFYNVYNVILKFDNIWYLYFWFWEVFLIRSNLIYGSFIYYLIIKEV